MTENELKRIVQEQYGQQLKRVQRDIQQHEDAGERDIASALRKLADAFEATLSELKNGGVANMVAIFKKNLSAAEFPNEKCRWCVKRIGSNPDGTLLYHFPIPVCAACFHYAYQHTTPNFFCNTCYAAGPTFREGFDRATSQACEHVPAAKWPGNLWERLMTEFRSEAQKWVKRISSRPSVTEVIQLATETRQEVVALERQKTDWVQGGHRKEAEKLSEEISHKTKAVSQLQRSLADIAKLDKTDD